MPAANPRAATLAVLAALTLACASGVPSPPVPGGAVAADSVAIAIERACEAALARVDALIAIREAEADFPPARLSEARALRAAALDLFSAGDASLALEFLESAESLLEGDAE